MPFLNFWMFKLLAGLICVVLFVKLISESGLDDTPFFILIPFALPLIALYWMNYSNQTNKKKISKKRRKN